MRQILSFVLVFALVIPSFAVARLSEVCDLNLNRIELDASALESLAVEIMRQTDEHERNGTDTVLGWLKSIRDSEAEHPLTVMEHVALVFILKKGIFANHEDPQVLETLTQSIRLSYKNLAKVELEPGHETDALPASVMRESSLASLIFHDTIVKPTIQTQARQQVGPMNFFNTVSVLISAVAIAFEPGRAILAGGLVGLTEASINEYMIHIGIGHASKDTAKSWRRFGKIGEFAEQIAIAHKLHHTVVAAYYGAANLPPEQQAMAERTMRKLTENLVLDRMKDKYPDLSVADIKALPEYQRKVDHLLEATRKGNYGINGTFAGATAMLATAAPFWILNYGLYVLTGSHAFLDSVDMSLAFWILQSLYSHWYLHLAPQDENMPDVNPFQLYYVKHTWMGQLARRLHFTHHDLPYDGDRTANGVIMAGSVYDRMLSVGSKALKAIGLSRGNSIDPLTMPRIDDLVKMFEEGYLTDPP